MSFRALTKKKYASAPKAPRMRLRFLQKKNKKATPCTIMSLVQHYFSQ